MARPEKPIDWNVVDKMIEAQCSGKEIAGYFNICDETFYERFKKEHDVYFSSYLGTKSQCGKGLLKLAQYNKALNASAAGNTQMLIWLGKNILGQKEHHETLVAPNDKALNDIIEELKRLNELKPKIESGVQKNGSV